MSAPGPAARLNSLADLAEPFAVRVVATLRVADHIASGVDTLHRLADVCGADADALGRLLRFLTHRGVFVEPSPDVFGLTDVGRMLVDTGTAGRRAWFDLDGLGYRIDMAYSGLLHSVRTGEPGYGSVHGMSLWDHLNRAPDSRAYFDDLMRTQHSVTGPQVAELYPWNTVDHVVDVGGGDGTALVHLLTAHPHLRGTVVDQPGPVGSANRRFAELGLADRATAVAGDFFGELPLPPAADVYTISRVLTDWPDAAEAAILARCATAAGPSGRILIVEVLPCDPFVPYATDFDLSMLVTVGGRERDVADHAALAAGAGLAVSGTWRGRDGLLLVELSAA